MFFWYVIVFSQDILNIKANVHNFLEFFRLPTTCNFENFLPFLFYIFVNSVSKVCVSKQASYHSFWFYTFLVLTLANILNLNLNLFWVDQQIHNFNYFNNFQFFVNPLFFLLMPFLLQSLVRQGQLIRVVQELIWWFLISYIYFKQ